MTKLGPAPDFFSRALPTIAEIIISREDKLIILHIFSKYMQKEQLKEKSKLLFKLSLLKRFNFKHYISFQFFPLLCQKQ